MPLARVVQSHRRLSRTRDCPVVTLVYCGLRQDTSRVSIRVGCFCTKHRKVKGAAGPRIGMKDMVENDSAAYASAGRYNKISVNIIYAIDTYFPHMIIPLGFRRSTSGKKKMTGWNGHCRGSQRQVLPVTEGGDSSAVRCRVHGLLKVGCHYIRLPTRRTTVGTQKGYPNDFTHLLVCRQVEHGPNQARSLL